MVALYFPYPSRKAANPVWVGNMHGPIDDEVGAPSYGGRFGMTAGAIPRVQSARGPADRARGRSPGESKSGILG